MLSTSLIPSKFHASHDQRRPRRFRLPETLIFNLLDLSEKILESDNWVMIASAVMQSQHDVSWQERFVHNLPRRGLTRAGKPS